MNYLPLAALMIASASLAISIITLITVLAPKPAPRERISRFNPPEEHRTEDTTAKQFLLAQTAADTPPARPGPTTQMIRRIDADLPRPTGRRAARKDQA